MISPGKIVDQRWWCCANCGQKLAEIIGQRAVIRWGDKPIGSMALWTDPDITCPKCGQPSVPPGDLVVSSGQSNNLRSTGSM